MKIINYAILSEKNMSMQLFYFVHYMHKYDWKEIQQIIMCLSVSHNKLLHSYSYYSVRCSYIYYACRFLEMITMGQHFVMQSVSAKTNFAFFQGTFATSGDIYDMTV